MKKFLLVVVLAVCFIAGRSQTLFTYGKYVVSKDEFLHAYNKNKTTTGEKPLSIKDYLDLYVKFKLKVQAAKDMHLDTLASIKSDIETSKTQLENNYMQDDKEVDALVNEAFQRSQHDLHVQHFYVPVNGKMPPVDTSKAVAAINKVYKELKEGKENYFDIVSEVSEKISPVKGNDLGWITVFTLPYEYENIVYRLSPGEVSKPYRSKTGWHVFKLEEERPALGKITVAQILLAVPHDNIVLRDRNKQLADSIYDALKAGAGFGTLAKQYSNDRRTFMNNGIMPEFGIATYDGDFEKEAFALQHDSDISRPFQTTFGFHILKRISRSRIPENKDEAYMFALRQQVQSDDRISIAKEKFLQEVLQKTGFKKNTSLNQKEFWRMTDSLTGPATTIHTKNITDKTLLFSFNDNSKVTVGDWTKYIKNMKQTGYEGQIKSTHDALLKNYISAVALENYRKRLPAFAPEFKQQLREFKDGDMFFEIMQKKVWAKASDDSIGLVKYYDDHKQNYKWSASADVVLFSCADAEVAATVSKEINAANWRDMVKDNAQVQTDSGRYELTQIPVNGTVNFTQGLITRPVVNSGDGTAVFALILNTYPANEQRSFIEARGLVINDYQNVLEKKWVTELEKKYPVKINEKVFAQINR